jgi:N-acetylneuraminic acid mutarotase
VGGGYNPGNSFEAYDISESKWSSKAVLDYWGEFPAACALDGKIYYMGGWYQNPAYDYLQVYDPASNSWEMKAPMPRNRTGHMAFPIGGKIFVTGGYSEWPAEEFYNMIDVYDPAEDSWSTLASPPGSSDLTSRWGFGACMAGGRIYVIGGTDAIDYMPPGTTIPALDIVEVYNPETNTWSKRASMPTPRWGLAAVTVGDKIYAIGGYSEWEPKTFTPVVEVYDPATDTWEAQGSLPKARGSIVAVEHEGIIYIPGGGGFEARDEWDYFSSYDPACGASAQK